MIKGIAFDLDGTLTRPAREFEGLRSKIGGLKSGIPIYEQALQMPEPEKSRALAILEEVELDAAKGAEPNPGLYELMSYLAGKQIRKAIFTRNSRQSLDLTLSILQLAGKFEPMVTREQGLRLKPDPEMILYILRNWNFAPEEVLVAGDFVFDVMAGRGAGCKTILVNHRQSPSPQPALRWAGLDEPARPEYLIGRLDQMINIVEELNGKGSDPG